jgi:tetratricopeptide (TPR) repeat protein
MTPHRNFFARALAASSLIFIGTMPGIAPVNAQMSESWNVHSREKAEALNSNAISLLNTRQTDRAIALLRHANAADPNDPVPFATLGLALATQGEYAEGLDSLQKSYSLRPTNETLLSTGFVYFLQHDYDAAINAWNKVLQANPKLCHVYGNIGMAYLRKGDLGQANEAFQRVVRCAPNSDLGYYGLALSNYLAGNFAASRTEGQRALAINNYPPTVLLMANLDLMTGDQSRGKRRAQQYNSMRHKFQQRSMTEIGYPTQHDFHYDPFIADNFDNGYLLLARVENNPHRAQDLAYYGKSKHVISSVKDQLSRFPGDLFLTRELGLAQMADGDFSSSSESFKSALNQCSGCHADLLNLGRSLALDGKTDQSSETVRQFQNQEPSQEASSVFTESARVDPGLQYNVEAHKRLQRMEKVGPKPVPSNQF